MNAALLSIDVASELRKVAAAEAESAWQLPAELVRRAVGAGARRVDVALGRRTLVVSDDGAGLGRSQLEQLALVADPNAADAARHAAVVALEAAPGLLALAHAGASLLLASGGITLVRGGPGVRPALERGATGSGARLELAGVRIDAARARAWLEATCRFCPAVVTIDGRPLPRGFADAIAEAPLAPPLLGRLALPREGEAGVVQLLHHGVVAARVSVPDAPAFAAAVEMAGLAASRNGAGLREAIAPHLPGIVDAAVGLALEAGGRVARLQEEDRKRVRAALLVAARLGRRRADVFRLPLLRALFGPEGEGEAWLSLLELPRDRDVACLDPRQDPNAFLLGSGPAVVIDAEERGRLAQLLGLRFRLPERRHIAPTLGARARRLRARAAAAARRLWLRVRHPRLGADLSEGALSEEERQLAVALRAALPGLEIALTAGSGAVRRVAADRWRLPRGNPAVAASARAVARDPRWAYPACFALLEDRAAPSSAAREAWRARP